MQVNRIMYLKRPDRHLSGLLFVDVALGNFEVGACILFVLLHVLSKKNTGLSKSNASNERLVSDYYSKTSSEAPLWFAVR